jgi:serine/threonine-protein kinase
MSAKGTLGQMKSGDVFAGKFRLDRQFAAGGMGFVWRAWNMQLDIPVAVKFMAAAMIDSPDLVARFEREARAAAQIRSPHVVSIYEHGVYERLPYMVMELLEGEDLSHRLKRETRLPMLLTAKIVRDMCKALHRAHSLGIVHRDLKPANVFLARDGEDEIVKILDFGIAKLTQGGNANMTATGEMIGTPSYMSPEHIQASKSVDPRADLWAVSVIAFRALTGQLPFTGQILDVVDRILAGAAPVPSSLAPDLSPAVDAFFARALNRTMDQRFQSARELAEALDRLVGRESLFEPSLVPAPSLVRAPAAEDLPTIAALRTPAFQSTPRAAVDPAIAAADLSTVRVRDRGGQKAFNAAPPGGAAPRKTFTRTIPLGMAPLVLPGPGGQSGEALAPAAAPEPQSRTWIAVVVLSVLVVIAAAVWAGIYLGRAPERKAAPAPPVSAVSAR